jgi:tetratricopeptide (TPR) repeat protein
MASEDDSNALRDKAQLLLAADHYTALGLSRNASADAVGRAFVQAAKIWHPDRAPSKNEELRALFAKVFARLDLARATLSDPSRRARYLDELSGHVKMPSDRPASSMEVSVAEATLEYRKADALLKKNDTARAEEHLRRACQLAPTNGTYHAVLISLQAQKPNVTKVELAKLAQNLDPLIDRDPKCERAFFVRGSIRKRLDRLAEANADFKRAAELDPNNLDATREVRIFEMRQANAAPKPKEKAPTPEGGGGGGGGFFKKLFKR